MISYSSLARKSCQELPMEEIKDIRTMKTIEKIKLLERLKKAVKNGAIGQSVYNWGGLCAVIATSDDNHFGFWDKKTTVDERTYLHSIIPKRRRKDDFCWKPGIKAPRIRFINEKIAQLKKRLK